MNVKVCFKCGQYIPIHPNNSINQIELKNFEGVHSGHPIQTINRNEVPSDFMYITEARQAKAIKKTRSFFKKLFKL